MTPRLAARAIDALRRGWPVAIAGDDGRIALLPVETADDTRLAAFDPDGSANILLSSGRAATLKLANQRDAATPGLAVAVARAPWLDLPTAIALADPALDLANPLHGPYRAIPVDAPDAAAAALRLARLAGLLPAFFVRPDAPDIAVELTAQDVTDHDAPARLAIAARARLPVAAAEQAEIVAFRPADGGIEHIAIVVGEPHRGEPVLVRLHSECFTGDLLGSLRCDCGDQLRGAIRLMAEQGSGVLLYLAQEGRGIGLINKLRAYRLQDQGFDTMEANRRLGFAEDERLFRPAAEMLKRLGFTTVRLLTNNPDKVDGLRRLGIDVVERVAHSFPPNAHNARYLAASATAPATSCDTAARRYAAGLLHAFGRAIPCAIGRSGACPAEAKREGDGMTPLGTWPVRTLLLRRDRVPPVASALPWRWLRPDDGWSDDPTDPGYNRPCATRTPSPLNICGARTASMTRC
jgi:GTP cyclohydrolase II